MVSAATPAAAPPRRLPPRATTLAAQPETLQVSLAGTLLCDAEMRLAIDTPTVIVLIGQPGRPPVRAVEAFPASPSGQYAAYAKARGLRAGTHIQLRGEGLRTNKIAGCGEVVQVGSVSELRPLHAPFDAGRAAANDLDRPGSPS